MPKISTKPLDMFDLPLPWCAAIFLFVQALALYPIFAHDVISINDLNNHLARVWILLHYDQTPAIHRFYRIDWQMLPNLAIDTFGLMLGRLVSLDWIGKLFVASTFVLILSGVVHLHHAIAKKWSSWSFLAAFFLFNRPFLAGVTGYLIGVGLYLHAVALWIGLRDRNALLRVVVSCALSLTIFFAHLFAFGLLGVTIFGVELVQVLKTRSDPALALRNFVLAGVQFVAPLVVFLFLTPHEPADAAVSYRGVWSHIAAFGAPILYDTALDASLLGAMAIAAVIVAVKANARIEPGLAVVMALLVAVQFLMPDAVVTARGADRRIPIVLCLLVIAGIDISAASRRLQWAFMAIIVTVLGIRVWTIDDAWTSYDSVYAETSAMLEAIPPGASVATAYRPGTFENSATPAIAVFSLPVRYAVEHGGFSQPIFAFPAQNPVVLQPDYRELARRWSPETVWLRFATGDDIGVGGQPDRRDLEILRRYDFVVFVSNGAPIRVPPTPLLSPVRQGRWAQVYRVEK